VTSGADGTLVVELEHVEDPELHRAVPSRQAERIADRRALPQALVDDEVAAVVAAKRRDALLLEVGEHPLVEAAGVRLAPDRAGGGAHDVVVDVVAQGGQHTLDVVGALERVVIVDDLVHLLPGRYGHRRLLPARPLGVRDRCCETASHYVTSVA
jgi:hypothetical protein